jgi:hypothetical protein
MSKTPTLEQAFHAIINGEDRTTLQKRYSLSPYGVSKIIADVYSNLPDEAVRKIRASRLPWGPTPHGLSEKEVMVLASNFVSLDVTNPLPPVTKKDVVEIPTPLAVSDTPSITLKDVISYIRDLDASAQTTAKERAKIKTAVVRVRQSLDALSSLVE